MGKKWIITAAVLILIGCLIFGGVMAMLGWDFTKLSTVKYETNEYDISDVFENISIVSNTADITLLPSEDFTCRVVCYEQESVKHAVSVKDGTLTIAVEDTRKWYQHISIGFEAPKITVYLPSFSLQSSVTPETIPDELLDPEYVFTMEVAPRPAVDAAIGGTIQIRSSTGDIRIQNIAAQGIDLSLSTGKVTFDNVSCSRGDIKVKLSTGETELAAVWCKKLISEGSTGDISLKKVIATESFSIQRSTGDIEFESCEAPEIFAKTTTGDIEGSLLVDKFFIANTSTGDVDVPKNTNGGKCELTTSTGDIEITIAK